MQMLERNLFKNVIQFSPYIVLYHWSRLKIGKYLPISLFSSDFFFFFFGKKLWIYRQETTCSKVKLFGQSRVTLPIFTHSVNKQCLHRVIWGHTAQSSRCEYAHVALGMLGFCGCHWFYHSVLAQTNFVAKVSEVYLYFSTPVTSKCIHSDCRGTFHFIDIVFINMAVFF